MAAMTSSATSSTSGQAQPSNPALPAWARELIAQYESGAASQFILHGNVNDRMLLPLPDGAALGNLTDFLRRVLLARFDVVLSYDPGNGIRLEQGEQLFCQWPSFRESAKLPRDPRPAIETLTHYFRYTANLAAIQGERPPHVGCYLLAADLVAPAGQGWSGDINALAVLMRDWSAETTLVEAPLATFLITENLNDLHPLLVNNPRAAQIKITLPTPEELGAAFGALAPRYPRALAAWQGDFAVPAQQLSGATLGSIESLLRVKEHKQEPLAAPDLVQLKKQLVERDCQGLIEFIESTQTLDDFSGQPKIREWLRQDIALWRQGDLQALPMGYLFCGPVGTGKTYLVRCLAGEAGVPVVRLRNFRDKWVGSTEGNLEKIFRLIHALGRCIVFIDEADQALGRRNAGGDDSGVSGRIYSMLAEEMSDTRNRGRIMWALASSRPDLIEVDLKRPGRVDVKIPIFPTSTPRESFDLLRALARRREIELPEAEFESLKDKLPLVLTPGAAEALVVKVYRLARTQKAEPLAVLRECLDDYQNPVPADVMAFQIGLAAREASDLDFVPEAFRAAAAPQA